MFYIQNNWGFRLIIITCSLYIMFESNLTRPGYLYKCVYQSISTVVIIVILSVNNMPNC